ncbi:MAG TPA: ABC transporter permease [Clostridia bacterium]|nr:ABC transporter permease [Clostridia bacterium]
MYKKVLDYVDRCKSISLLKDKNINKLFLITIFVFILMSSLRPNLFLSKANFMSMAYQFPELGFLAIATTFVIISGGIDLSIVSIANLSAIVCSFILVSAREQTGAGLIFTILLVFFISTAIGCVCGLINGFFIAKFNIPPILVTLGTMNLFTGIGIVLTKGLAISNFPPAFLVIGNGHILGIPIVLIMFIIALSISAFILNNTSYGFKLRFYGSNSIASWFSGIENLPVVLKTYIFSGVLSSFVGIIFLARMNSAKADYGNSYLLHAILCALLGGVDPKGGYGKISGMLLALVSLQFLTSGFNMLRFNAFYKDLVWGLLLLLVMAINYTTNQKALKAKSSDK